MCIDKKFKSVEEFIDELKRGGEIEFKFQDNNYSITHPEGKLCFIKVGDDDSIAFFTDINEFLKFRIGDRYIYDIIMEIDPYFRCF